MKAALTILFVVVFFLIGILLLYRGYSDWKLLAESAHWHSVPMRVVRVEIHDVVPVEYHPGPASREINVVYSYVIAGHQYWATRLGITENSYKAKVANELFDRLELSRTTGSPIMGFVDPHDPQQSLLIREDKDRFTLFPIAGLASMLFSIFVLLMSIRFGFGEDVYFSFDPSRFSHIFWGKPRLKHKHAGAFSRGRLAYGFDKRNLENPPSPGSEVPKNGA